MPGLIRTAAGSAALLAILAVVAVLHHRLFGIRPSGYLTLASMLLLFAIAMRRRGDDGR